MSIQKLMVFTFSRCRELKKIMDKVKARKSDGRVVRFFVRKEIGDMVTGMKDSLELALKGSMVRVMPNYFQARLV